ncbi:MAG: hypothetical protein IJW47_00995, partial [Clostridia bacterium]|nr:hypothetical protein [Clostridia bacterium]
TVEEIMQFMDENERTLRENPFARKQGVVVPDKPEKKEKVQETPESNQTIEKQESEKETVKKKASSKKKSQNSEVNKYLKYKNTVLTTRGKNYGQNYSIF